MFKMDHSIMKEKTTIVTRIRNRNAILADTIQNWATFGIPVIIIDWRDESCESAWDVVRETGDLVKVIETKYEYMFNPAHAWNLGISQVQTEYALCLDVDDILEPHFFEANVPVDNGYICGEKYDFHLYGVCYIRKTYWDAVGGFSENMIYMGHADTDLYRRLRAAGYYQVGLAWESVKHKDHPAALKLENQLQDAGELQRQECYQEIWDTARYLNERIAVRLPWSVHSPRTKWAISELEKNRYLAIRNVRKI